MKRSIPLTSMETLLKKSGAQRVSSRAKSFLRQHLEEYSGEIILEAGRYAEHAGRKTIKAPDIKLATKQERA